MRELAVASTLSGRRRWKARGVLSWCLVVAGALTSIVVPRASSTTPARPASEPAVPAPVAPVAPILSDNSAVAELLIVGRGRFQPMEVVSRLFPQPQGSMHALIATAAAANDLPPDFFLRLLRQESGLNPLAVSPVGAQGIAQFMPGTAMERGVRNPFDPMEAIPKSAELLREHRAHFGNLGLAAAAYNAGPQRVRQWLGGRSGMPGETRDYVIRITGRTVEDWASENGRTMPQPVTTLMGTRDLGFASTWPTSAFSRQAGLAITRPAPRTVLAPAVRSAKRPLPRPPVRSQQPRSEQALCALLNGEGRTCLVQATY